ncbi:MAG TPA: VOC family protein [Solirubrobacterales bacterium]|nr:VOC family protein [Solirubrobacterales bacterium]
MSRLRMRQICLVARHLEPVVGELSSVLGLEVCHRDPGVGKYGLENALFPVGDQFLEVVAPVREGTTAGRYLDRRGGDGGYMVITQCEDLAPRRKRCEALGVRVANEIGHPEYRELQLHPRDVGAAMLSFGWQEGARYPGGPWHPAAWRGAVAGRGAAEGEPSGYKKSTAAKGPTAITGMSAAELQSDDPERLARRWSEVIERPVETRDGQRVIVLDDATLRFTEATDGRGEGLGGLDLACPAPGSVGLVQICGIRFRLTRP